MLTKNFWRYNLLAFRVAFEARKYGASIEEANREASNAIILQIWKDSQKDGSDSADHLGGVQ